MTDQPARRRSTAADLSADFARLEARVQELSNDIAEMKAERAKHDDRLDNSVSRLATRLSLVEANIAGVQVALGSLTKAIDALSARLEADAKERLADARSALDQRSADKDTLRWSWVGPALVSSLLTIGGGVVLWLLTGGLVP